MNGLVNINELIKRIIKYLVQGFMIAIVAYAIPKRSLDVQEIGLLALTSFKIWLNPALLLWLYKQSKIKRSCFLPISDIAVSKGFSFSIVLTIQITKMRMNIQYIASNLFKATHLNIVRYTSVIDYYELVDIH